MSDVIIIPQTEQVIISPVLGGQYGQFVQSDEIRNIKRLTQAAYDALGSPQASTLYIIID